MLTPNQRLLARLIVQKIRNSEFRETFYITWGLKKFDESLGAKDIFSTSAIVISEDGMWSEQEISESTLDVLDLEGFLQVFEAESYPWPKGARQLPVCRYYRCTVRQKIFDAVDSNFAPTVQIMDLSDGGLPPPPEITVSLKRLKAKYPDSRPLGFLVMRFAKAKPFDSIVTTIKQTAEEHDVVIIRADENEFHGDLWGNVRTLLHACSFGVAIYDRIESNEPNANIGLEVGYLMAVNKPVLLLKDQTLATLQSDLAGKLYKPFNPYDPSGTIPDQLGCWLKDNGIVV